MGVIANQMAMELLQKLVKKCKNRRAEKKQADGAKPKP